jgi:hypothetical protein
MVHLNARGSGWVGRRLQTRSDQAAAAASRPTSFELREEANGDVSERVIFCRTTEVATSKVIQVQVGVTFRTSVLHRL